jgi:uncharacterized protein YndB with AHSA1/START domain
MEVYFRTMTNSFIQKSIEIQAPVSKVWRVFRDPTLTRQIGGEYISEWRVGSSFSWKALDGNILTHGKIMKIEPEKFLQHTLLNSVGMTNSVITYEFDEKDGVTLLRAREDFTNPITDKEYGDAEEGWDAALQAVKKTAERR